MAAGVFSGHGASGIQSWCFVASVLTGSLLPLEYPCIHSRIKLFWAFKED